MMRKCLLIFIFASILIFSLFGCGQSGPNLEDTSISDIATANIGDVVKLGDYGGNALKWYVAYKEDGLYLLVSEGIVIEKPYNDEGGSTDSTSDLFYANEWSNCSLREWLNEDFYYNAFSDTAREYIVKCKLTNSIEEAYTKSGGLDTKDKVFILSYSECDKFLSQNGLLDVGGKTFWLRNPSGTNGLSAKTCNGTLSTDLNKNSSNVDTKQGVRPAIWVTDKDIDQTELNVAAATHERNTNSYSPDNFGYYDHDGDGQISDEEFQEATEYWMDQQEAGSNASSNDPNDFGYYDYDGDGQISDEEFQDALEYYLDENGY